MQDAVIRSFIERYELPDEAFDELRRLKMLPENLLPNEPVNLSEETWSSNPIPREAKRIGPYEDLGTLGTGGMAEVRRVRDPVLNRVMAAKLLHPETCDTQHLLRFVEEAQVTAQLRHPSIVAVHELGRADDGRVYFTMEEVRGQTLVEVIDELHAASGHGRWGTSANEWSLEKVIEAFRRACQAVAYAHSRGVVHRDLKPANVMVGRFGEVFLLDWGLAKVFNQGHSEDLPAVVTKRSSEDSTATQFGRVLGTPAFMPPEQARGELDRVGTASDVYALGAILYTTLCGRAPFSGKSSDHVLRAVLAGPPRPLEDWEGIPPIPDHLAVICRKAMAREPTARHYDAMELAQDISSWLDGSQRKSKALELVTRARATLPAAAALKEEADRLMEESRERLEPIANHEPVDRKRPAWMLEDLAQQLHQKASMRVLEATRTLQAALNLAPELAEAHESLVMLYKRQHEEAEDEDDRDEADRLEVLLRDHDRGSLRRYLEGTGALTLHTDPPGARATLYRYVERDRRLVPEYLSSLGTTPIAAVPLPMGSYLVELEVEGRPKVRYPVRIERQQHWDGVPPGGKAPLPVRIPKMLRGDECYVPAGWTTSGGDPDACDSWLVRRKIWIDSVVFKKTPVTHRQYLEFINDLEQNSRKKEVQRWMPRFEQISPYLQDKEKVWNLRKDMFMFTAGLDDPVVMVDWHSAAAYAEWLARRTGQPWRLPDETTWEKAARGVDGRIYPWGNRLDPTWCNMRESQAGRPRMVPAGSFEADCSPYGILDMGGNCMDWCRDAYRTTGPPVARDTVVVREDPGQPRSIRGGHWYAVGQISRVCHRYRLDPAFRGYMLGFRLARSV